MIGLFLILRRTLNIADRRELLKEREDIQREKNIAEAELDLVKRAYLEYMNEDTSSAIARKIELKVFCLGLF